MQHFWRTLHANIVTPCDDDHYVGKIYIKLFANFLKNRYPTYIFNPAISISAYLLSFPKSAGPSYDLLLSNRGKMQFSDQLNVHCSMVVWDIYEVRSKVRHFIHIRYLWLVNFNSHARIVGGQRKKHC